jgi:predicted DNA-binding protein YlxM (UPF0122 family)
LIQDINNGLKTEEEGLTSLEFLAWEEDTYQNEKQMKVVDKMIDGHTYPYGVTPEEVVLEKERKREIMEFLAKLSSVLTDKQRKVLWLYAVEGNRPSDVASMLEISKPDFSNIKVRIKTIAERMSRKAQFREHLLPAQSVLEPHKPESCGLPFEFLMSQNDGGRTGRKYGRKVYISKEKCLIPEYFEQCFGKNHKVTCSLCEKCSRRDYFKSRE